MIAYIDQYSTYNTLKRTFIEYRIYVEHAVYLRRPVFGHVLRSIAHKIYLVPGHKNIIHAKFQVNILKFQMSILYRTVQHL